MSSRAVSKLINEEVVPLLSSIGFEWLTPNEASAAVGSATFAFQWLRTPTKFNRNVGLPTGSFSAGFGVEYGHRVPAGFQRHRDPITIGYETMRVRMFLSRNEARDGLERYPDVWPVGDAEAARWAVSDLVRSIQEQGSRFIEQWSDLDNAYDTLTDASAALADGRLGEPGMMLAGNPGSQIRLQHLALLAALRGDVEGEKEHIAQLLDLGAMPPFVARMAELNELEP